MDVRLKTVPFEFRGKTYTLACNMNVLADVQEAYNGDFSRVLTGRVEPLMEFLAAMLNDAADSAGWPERFTGREVGREFCSTEDLKKIKAVVMPLVTVALTADRKPGDAGKDPESGGKDPEDAEKEPEGDGKN